MHIVQLPNVTIDFRVYIANHPHRKKVTGRRGGEREREREREGERERERERERECSICMYVSRLLMNSGRLVATHKSRYFERKDGLAIGPGAFVAALEYASGREAIVVGKPEPAFYQSVMKELNLPPNEMVMIGDVSERNFCSFKIYNIIMCLQISVCE